MKLAPLSQDSLCQHSDKNNANVNFILQVVGFFGLFKEFEATFCFYNLLTLKP